MGHVLHALGNGGSAADAQHLTDELIGHYKRPRRPLLCVTLSADPTALTCISNDFSFEDVFARQVSALVRAGDVVAAFTTSGNSQNVVSALRVAQSIGAVTILFGGAAGGLAIQHATLALLAPTASVPRVQEIHTLMLHAISDYLDHWACDPFPKREELG